MKDPYEEVFKEIGEAFKKQTNFIIELAKRTLTAKEFGEFVETVDKKVNGDKDGQGKTIKWLDNKRNGVTESVTI